MEVYTLEANGNNDDSDEENIVTSHSKIKANEYTTDQLKSRLLIDKFYERLSKEGTPDTRSKHI